MPTPWTTLPQPQPTPVDSLLGQGMVPVGAVGMPDLQRIMSSRWSTPAQRDWAREMHRRLVSEAVNQGQSPLTYRLGGESAAAAGLTPPQTRRLAPLPILGAPSNQEPLGIADLPQPNAVVQGLPALDGGQATPAGMPGPAGVPVRYPPPGPPLANPPLRPPLRDPAAMPPQEAPPAAAPPEAPLSAEQRLAAQRDRIFEANRTPAAPLGPQPPPRAQDPGASEASLRSQEVQPNWLQRGIERLLNPRDLLARTWGVDPDAPAAPPGQSPPAQPPASPAQAQPPASPAQAQPPASPPQQPPAPAAARPLPARGGVARVPAVQNTRPAGTGQGIVPEGADPALPERVQTVSQQFPISIPMDPGTAPTGIAGLPAPPAPVTLPEFQPPPAPPALEERGLAPWQQAMITGGLTLASGKGLGESGLAGLEALNVGEKARRASKREAAADAATLRKQALDEYQVALSRARTQQDIASAQANLQLQMRQLEQQQAYQQAQLGLKRESLDIMRARAARAGSGGGGGGGRRGGGGRMPAAIQSHAYWTGFFLERGMTPAQADRAAVARMRELSGRSGGGQADPLAGLEEPREQRRVSEEDYDAALADVVADEE